ncbi:MAG: hypothetical protein WA885_12325 [Phormidesmis sp.]
MTRSPYRENQQWPFGTEAGSNRLWPFSHQEALDNFSESRLQHRLKHPVKRDRNFLKLIRRKRAQPSRLNQRLNSEYFRQRLWRRTLVASIVGVSLGTAAWGTLFVNQRVTLGGVPYPVVQTFWYDKAARDAYFGGDRQALHERLTELSVEEKIKAYYKPDFKNENELDLYIHQVMYNRTGYVGEAYQVNDHGRLSVRPYDTPLP